MFGFRLLKRSVLDAPSVEGKRRNGQGADVSGDRSGCVREGDLPIRRLIHRPLPIPTAAPWPRARSSFRAKRVRIAYQCAIVIARLAVAVKIILMVDYLNPVLPGKRLSG